MPEWLEALTVGEIGAVVAVIAGLAWFVKRAWPWLSRVKDFFDDLMGESARPGVQARPGVVEALGSLRVDLEGVRTLAEQAEYHSRPNGGGSAYDALLEELRNGFALAAADRQRMRNQNAADLSDLQRQSATDLTDLKEQLQGHIDQAESIHEEQASAIQFVIEQLPEGKHKTKDRPDPA